MGFDDYWKSNAFVDEACKDKVIYVGPVRDFDEQTCILSPPTIALAGLSESTTLAHLIDSYNFHLDNKYRDVVSSSLCLFDGEYLKCVSSAREAANVFVFDLIPTMIRRTEWKKFHFAFHMKENKAAVVAPVEDHRDIDALVDFIEGTGTKDTAASAEAKKKKKKNKRRSKNSTGVGSSAPAESDDGTRDSENLPEVGPDSAAEDIAQSAKESRGPDGAVLSVVNDSAPASVSNKNNSGLSREVQRPADKTNKIRKSATSDGNPSAPSVSTCQNDVPSSVSGQASGNVLSGLRTRNVQDGFGSLGLLSQNAIEEAAKEMGEKQARLQQMRRDMAGMEAALQERESELGRTSSLLQQIIDNNHLELTAYQQRLEAEEDKIARNEKEAAKVEGDLARLRDELARLERVQADLLAENCEARKAAKKLRRKRIQLEEAVGRQLAPLREAKIQLGREIQEMRDQLLHKNQAVVGFLQSGL
jgi:hypothetical protein